MIRGILLFGGYLMTCERCKKFVATWDAVKNPYGKGVVHGSGTCVEDNLIETKSDAAGTVVNLLSKT